MSERSTGDVVSELADIDGKGGSDAPNPELTRAEARRQEAIGWLSLISSGRATTADAEAFKRWCGEDPAHAEAYAQVARMWGLLTTVATTAKQADAAGLPRLVPRRVEIGRRAFFGGVFAASAAAAVYGATYPPWGLWPSMAELSADVRTSTGEQRRLNIASGVAVDLNTRSSLAWRSVAGDARHIEIISGEAVVDASPSADSACVVVAGNGRILAQGAKFDVRNDSHDGFVRVVCVDGRIRVEHRAHIVELGANQQVSYDARGLGATQSVDSALVTAWQQGRLVFRQEPLARVIDEVNRYRPGRLILLDDRLGKRLIDASFQLTHLDNVVVYLRQAYGVGVRALPGGVVLIG